MPVIRLAMGGTIACLLVITALWLAGCNIVGPVAAIAQGPPTVEAMYVLEDVPTVVFIDDRSNLVSPVTLRRTIADTASKELMVEECVTTTINPQDAALIAARSDRASGLMAVEDIGRAVGAQQVIFVTIKEFKSTADGYTPQPVATAEVKVINVTKGRRVFPPGDGPGFAVTTKGKPIDPSMYADRSSRLQIFEALSVQLGDEIAKVFYKHEVKELGERLQ